MYLLKVVKTVDLSKENKNVPSQPCLVKERLPRRPKATKILYLYANVIYMTLNVSWLVTHDSVPFFQNTVLHNILLYSLHFKVVFRVFLFSCVSMRL